MDAAESVYAPERVRTLRAQPSALPLVLLGIALAALLAVVEPLLPLRWRLGRRPRMTRQRSLRVAARDPAARVCGRIRVPCARHRVTRHGRSATARRNGSAGSCPRPPPRRDGAACGRGAARDQREERRAAGLSGLPSRPGQRDRGHGIPADPSALRGDQDARTTPGRRSRVGRDRSAVDVVLGVILTDSASTAGPQREQVQKSALAAFVRAIREDPANAAAKLDLEVLLQATAPRTKSRPRPSRPTDRKPRGNENPRNPTAPARAEGTGF